MKHIKTSLKEIPRLLKLFLVMDITAFFLNAYGLIASRPLEFNYYGAQFPSSTPYIWYIYSLAASAFSIFVLFKRSYSLLIKYLIYSMVMLIAGTLGSIYDARVNSDAFLETAIGYSIAFVICLLIFLYYYKQKKYFNKP